MVQPRLVELITTIVSLLLFCNSIPKCACSIVSYHDVGIGADQHSSQMVLMAERLRRKRSITDHGGGGGGVGELHAAAAASGASVIQTDNLEARQMISSFAAAAEAYSSIAGMGRDGNAFDNATTLPPPVYSAMLYNEPHLANAELAATARVKKLRLLDHVHRWNDPNCFQRSTNTGSGSPGDGGTERGCCSYQVLTKRRNCDSHEEFDRHVEEDEAQPVAIRQEESAADKNEALGESIDRERINQNILQVTKYSKAHGTVKNTGIGQFGRHSYASQKDNLQENNSHATSKLQSPRLKPGRYTKDFNTKNPDATQTTNSHLLQRLKSCLVESEDSTSLDNVLECVGGQSRYISEDIGLVSLGTEGDDIMITLPLYVPAQVTDKVNISPEASTTDKATQIQATKPESSKSTALTVVYDFLALRENAILYTKYSSKTELQCDMGEQSRLPSLVMKDWDNTQTLPEPLTTSGHKKTSVSFQNLHCSARNVMVDLMNYFIPMCRPLSHFGNITLEWLADQTDVISMDIEVDTVFNGNDESDSTPTCMRSSKNLTIDKQTANTLESAYNISAAVAGANSYSDHHSPVPPCSTATQDSYASVRNYYHYNISRGLFLLTSASTQAAAASTAAAISTPLTSEEPLMQLMYRVNYQDIAHKRGD